jgi:hypothetical protein
VKLRRLEAADALAFQRLRIEGLALQPREFRYAPQDEVDTPLAEVAARLELDFVVGVFHGDTLVGIAGLTRLGGVKTGHKALLWGVVSARRISRAGSGRYADVGDPRFCARAPRGPWRHNRLTVQPLLLIADYQNTRGHLCSAHQ